MKLFRCHIADKIFPNGAGEVLINLDQVVFMGSHPDLPERTLVKLTGDENVLLIMAPLRDVLDEVERLEE